MRMWGVNPKWLCNKHLLGEHVEMHMFTGTIQKNKSIRGYLIKGLVNPSLIKKRHDKLAEEMIERGMNHQSDLNIDCSDFINRPISIRKNEEELCKRCEICRERILEGYMEYITK
jgi:hypothetical protein